jgi:hypothetical protein
MIKNIKILLIVVSFIGILFNEGCTEDDPVIPQEEHFEAIGVYLSTSGIEVLSILRGVTNDTLVVQADSLGDGLVVQFYNEAEQIIDPPTGGQTLGFEVGDTSVVDIFQHTGEEGGFEFHLQGMNPGSTYIELFILHEMHSDFRSGQIPVRVEN